MYVVEVKGLPIMTERKVYLLHNIVINFFSKYCKNSFKKAIKFSIEMDYTEKTYENINYFEYWSNRENLYKNENKLKHLNNYELDKYWEIKKVTKCLVFFKNLSIATVFKNRVNTGYSNRKLNLRLDKLHILEANILEKDFDVGLSKTNINTLCFFFNMFNKKNEITDKNRKLKQNNIEKLPLDCIYLIQSNLTASDLLNFSKTNRYNRNIVINLNIWSIVNNKLLNICKYLDKVTIYKGIFEYTDKDLIKLKTSDKFNYYDVEFYVNSFEFTLKIKRHILSNVFKKTKINEIYRLDTFNLLDLIENIKSSKYF